MIEHWFFFLFVAGCMMLTYPMVKRKESEQERRRRLFTPGTYHVKGGSFQQTAHGLVQVEIIRSFRCESFEDLELYSHKMQLEASRELGLKVAETNSGS